MKRLRIIFFCIAFISCREKQDFSKIKAGMTGAEVVKLMGRPDLRKPMIETEWWLYLDPEKHVVIIRDDTVVRCITQAEAVKVMEETLKNVDSLKHI